MAKIYIEGRRKIIMRHSWLIFVMRLCYTLKLVTQMGMENIGFQRPLVYVIATLVNLIALKLEKLD